MSYWDDDNNGWGFGQQQQQPMQPLVQTRPMGLGAGQDMNPGLKWMLLGQVMQGGGGPMQAMQAINALESMKRAQGTQAELGQIFNGNGNGQPQAGPTGAPQAAPNDPKKVRADMYRRAADLMARSGQDESAKRYADIANQLDPAAEWSTPQTVIQNGKPVLVQFNKAGEVRPVEGYGPKPELTAPVASGNGMISMDQNTGEVRNLGVPAHQPTPAEIQEYQFAVQQGYKGDFNAFRLQKAQAGATRVSMNPQIRVGNTLGEEVAKGIADRTMESINQGDKAANVLQHVDTIRQNVDKAITGPANEPRTLFARAKELVGLGGAANQEALQATAKTAQAIAETELAAAEKMAKQGQITEAEREILRRTAAGKMNMTAEEILASTEVLEKISRAKITQAQRNAKAMQAVPDFKPLFPFIDQRLGSMPEGGPAITPMKPPGKRGAAGKVQPQANVVQELPMNVRPGTRARDKTTGQILVFDGKEWKAQ